MICSLGDETETRLPEIEGACVDSRGVVMATSGAQGPPELLLAPPGSRNRQMWTEVGGHRLIQTLPKVAFHSACSSSSLCSCFIWWHLIEKVILSLYKNKAWTSCNTGTKNTLYSQDGLSLCGKYKTKFLVPSTSL